MMSKDHIDQTEHVSQSRRRLLLGTDSVRTQEERQVEVVINPPWSVALSVNCTKCGDCVNACPEQILIVSPMSGLPEVDFSKGECTFCQLCAEACDENVFDLTVAESSHQDLTQSDLSDKGLLDQDSSNKDLIAKAWDLSVVIEDSCLLTKRIFCRGCGDACPERAIRFALQQHNKTDIVVDAALCTGCGACVSPCPVDAVKIMNNSVTTNDDQSVTNNQAGAASV